jgi:hypothetical protein
LASQVLVIEISWGALVKISTIALLFLTLAASSAHSAEDDLPPGIPETTMTHSDCFQDPKELDIAIKAEFVNQNRMSLPACQGLWQAPLPQKAIQGERTYVDEGPGYEVSCRVVRRNYFHEALRKTFLSELPVQADLAHATSDKKLLKCISVSLYEWAKRDSFTVLGGKFTAPDVPDGDLRGNQVGRATALEIVASVYFKYPALRARAMESHSTYAENHHVMIKDWLRKLATLTLEDGPSRWTKTRASNVVYRQGNALMLVGLITGNQSFLAHGRLAFELGVWQITSEGFLPRELIRQSRALGYHASALAPLMSIFTLSQATGCGIKLSSDEEDRFLRLIARVMQGQKNPEAFSTATKLVAQADTGQKAAELLTFLSAHPSSMSARLDSILKEYGLGLRAYEAKGYFSEGSNRELGGTLLPIVKEVLRRQSQNPVCAN